MRRLVFCNGSLVIVGITVQTAMRAGIVGADVDALDAAACRALVAIFARPHAVADEPCHEAIINTFSLSNPCFLQAFSRRTGLQSDALGGSNLLQAVQAIDVFCFCRLQELQIGHVSPTFAVHLDKADDAFVGMSSQLAGQRRKNAGVKIRGITLGEENRIVSPEHLFFADPPGEVLEGFDAIGDSRHIGFDLGIVGREGEEEVIGVAEIIYYRQFVKEWAWILAPEDQAFNPCR